MPFIDFDKKNNNKGSVNLLVDYLEKENKGKEGEEVEKFFNHDNEDISPNEVIESIDKNKRKLSKDESKYFSFIISPSQKELHHISNSKESLNNYVKEVMNIYAENFNKGIKGNDLLYFAKIENERKYKNFDYEVQQGFVSQYDKKLGKQTHVHVIVSRRAKNNGPRLSPKDNAKGGDHFVLNGKKIKRGFNVNLFKEKAEKKFDNLFNYKREIDESFDFLRLKKHYPVEFKKKYGKENFSLSVDNRSVSEGLNPEVYLKERIKEAALSSKNRKEFERQLKDKGITIKKNKVSFKGVQKDIKSLLKGLSKDINNIIGAYYVVKKLSDTLSKSSEQDQEQEI